VRLTAFGGWELSAVLTLNHNLSRSLTVTDHMAHPIPTPDRIATDVTEVRPVCLAREACRRVGDRRYVVLAHKIGVQGLRIALIPVLPARGPGGTGTVTHVRTVACPPCTSELCSGDATTQAYRYRYVVTRSRHLCRATCTIAVPVSDTQQHGGGGAVSRAPGSTAAGR